MSIDMKKKHRIKKNDEFQTVFQKGKSNANRQFVVYQLDKEEQPNFRIGLSVSKKIGNAVVRNRIKRMIRQSITELKDEIDSGKDFVIIARKPCAEMTYEELKKSLIHVFKRSGMKRIKSSVRK
ncbi:Ribonuclease P protein component [Bacillus cereus 95/8201]|nr:ribonuclease P protein component [Bacillus thuringiensis str. Al Hakam]AFH86863.1 Ribonuclease P protein component [Bacillus anthracis str. H9401]AHK41623.1 Ribonuclease P protein component [Bacillus anthracis str. SVA11]AIM09365.1 ribonuclease P [Bacillus anthracis]EEK53468.1 Ribonuclease P protein component [Bacillus cereus BGSC 6E1]EEL14157.1 Ribonuclease P protein component [Bacillus cereus 95/8201]EEL42676.1 Ribonuclease P protein component [Bacillus cereus Rock3-42]EEM56845.1 Ribonu